MNDQSKHSLDRACVVLTPLFGGNQARARILHKVTTVVPRLGA